jgi:hypothetical protein
MGSFHIPGQKELSYIHVPRTGLGVKKIIKEWFRPNFENFYIDPWMTNHPNLRMLRERIPTGKTFALVRNPWMRVYSLYRKIAREGYWLDWNMMQPTDLKPFNEWLEDYANPAWEFKWPRWFDRWTLMSEFIEYKDLDGNYFTVDFLLRSETLEKDFEQVRDYLNCNILLPDLSMHEETDDYRKHYTDKGAEYVYKVYARDIIKYGYKF